jgi:hypothetical protein
LEVNQLKNKTLQGNYDCTALLAPHTATPSNNPNVNTGSVISCSCQGNTCNAGAAIHVNSLPHQPVAISGLNSSDFPLQIFDENWEVNPVFCLKRLEEFLKLWGVPQMYHLTVACRSIVGKLSRQWLETISDKLTMKHSKMPS